MDKEVAGQPLWLWGLGAVIVIGGYLYFRSHASPASSSTQGSQGTNAQQPSTSTTSFRETIKDMQSSPKKKA